MGLFNRQKESKGANLPAELKPYYNDGAGSKGRAWLGWAVRVIVLIVLIALTTLFVRWVWHTAHDSNPTKSPTTSQAQSSKPHTPIKKSPNTTKSPTTAQPTPTPSSQPTTTSPPPPPATATGDLTNTGPSGTVLVFLVATVTGIITYEVRLRNRSGNRAGY